MNTQKSTPNRDNNAKTIARVAADWCMRVQSEDCSAAERAALEQWLKQDPAHEQAYHKILRVWSLSEQLAPTLSADQPQPARTPTTPPDSPQPHPAHIQPPRRRHWQYTVRVMSLAVLLLVPLGYGGWLLDWVPNEYHRYSSNQSRQEVMLPDGTRVEMNLNTQISYANYRDRRHVSINGNGEAFFNVSHDAGHPFEISAGNGTITVTGTAFNVWKYRKDVVVTVAEGSVVVSNETAEVRLTPGMRAEYTAHHPPRSEPGDIDQAVAWQSGKLILDDLPLALAIPQIGRYLEQPITLNDDAVAKLRIGGIYNTENMDDLVASLPQALPLTVEERFFGGLVLSSRPH